jgi:hypothetical protein
VVRPTWRGLPTARMVPSRLLRMWLQLISRPKAPYPGGQFKKPPTLATLSARATVAPPWRKPKGWWTLGETASSATTSSFSAFR